jgi:hypothetical protein
MRPVVGRLALALLLLGDVVACNERKAEQNVAVIEDPDASADGNSAAPIAASGVAIPKVAPVCTAAAANLNVVIKSKVGPGGGAILPFGNKLLSMNLDDLKPNDYMPSFNADFVAYLKALKPAMLRWPAGYDSQTYQFDAGASWAPTSKTAGRRTLAPNFIDQYLALCKAVGAEPYVGINLLTGTADNAASLVRYLNVSKNAGVRWFHLGNEPDVDVTDSATQTAAYAKQFLAFRQAMLAVDGNLKFTGAELVTGARVLGIAGQPNWMAPILAGTKAAPMDAIAWHYYPKDSSQTLAASSATPSPEHLLLETASDWPPAGLDFASQIFPKLQQVRNQLAPKAELWVDEFAEDSGKANGTGLADRAVGALWTADALGRFAEQGADAVFRFIFKTGEDHGYALLDPNNVLRPDYYAMWLYANAFGDQLVSATSSAQANVAAHAALRQGDGSLRVMLVNKTTSPQKVAVSLPDFAASASGRYQLLAKAYLDTSMSLNGSALTAASVANGEAAVAIEGTADACAQTVLTLPPVSVTVMAYAP